LVARLTIFFLVVLAVVGGVHFYVWARLVRDTQLPAPFRVWGTAAVVALALSLPATLLVLRRLRPAWSALIAWPAFLWMGLVFVAFVLLLATDVIRVLILLAARVGATESLDPGRRLLLSRLLGGGAGVATGVVGAYAVHNARSRLVVEEVTVRLARLPPGAAGTTIVQITDLHIGATIARSFVEHVVRETNALVPDLIAITGDLVDGSVERLRDAVAPLGGLRARHGVFFVTGNHEYYSGVARWVLELEHMGIRVLRNERVTIGQGDNAFDLAGIDDWSSRRHDDGSRPDLPRALAGRDPSRAVVLLAHQPRAVVEAAQLGVDLQLSGHTHGGQIWPFGLMVMLQQPYIAGLHRHGDTFIYVSAGTGYWGPPMRLGTRSELTRITLVQS
jgi:predicted MPP superfamily phosphohydrolase